MTITDEMVERAWAAIIGKDIADQCFQANIIRADLRVALEAACIFEDEELLKLANDFYMGKYLMTEERHQLARFVIESLNKPFYGAECPSYPNCKGGCGLGCTHNIEARRASLVTSQDQS